jgi:hypothetical protein
MMPKPLARILLFTLVCSLTGVAASQVVMNPSVVVVYRPTVYTPNPPPSSPYQSPSYAMDTSLTTAAVARSVAMTGTDHFGLWSGFPKDVGATPKVLKITSSVFNDTTVLACVYMTYTLDGGNTWPILYTACSGRAQTTDSISLPSAQDITKVQVFAHTENVDYSDTGKEILHKIYDIRIEEGN